MRTNLVKLLAVVLILAMGVGVGSQAMAQDDEYPTLFLPRGENDLGNQLVDECADVLNYLTLEVQGNTLVVTFNPEAALCVANLLVEINPTLYNGPAPVTGILRLPVPTLAPDQDTITATVTTFSGAQYSASIKFNPATVAAANAAAGILPASVPAAVPAGQPLAFTGGNVSLPLLAGALMTGTGGLLVLASRKRRQD